MPEENNIVIIGAGVVGLAIAAELSHSNNHIYVFEKNRTFGLETSSHNSEVIHAGIYYPENSLKAKFCVQGNRLLYELCEKYSIPYKRLGKIIVAADDNETREVERLYRQGIKNGIDDLKLLSRDEVKKLEPNVSAISGLLSPSTGVIDSYNLMRSFHGRAKENGADFIYNTEVIGINKTPQGYKISVKDREGVSSIVARVVINSAGLFSDKVAQLAGIDIEKAGYKLYYCKGEYFSLSPRLGRLVNRLVYPIPEQAGVGEHITLSLDGTIRLGPNVKYVDTIDYSVDENDKPNFYRAAHRYLPAIELDDLVPDFAGVRPKLQGPGEDFRDFIIREESDKGLNGLIDLIGIESPGLTSSPAIVKYVAGIVSEILT